MMPPASRITAIVVAAAVWKPVVASGSVGCDCGVALVDAPPTLLLGAGLDGGVLVLGLGLGLGTVNANEQVSLPEAATRWCPEPLRFFGIVRVTVKLPFASVVTDPSEVGADSTESCTAVFAGNPLPVTVTLCPACTVLVLTDTVQLYTGG
jgi:hypothetical protein